MRGSRRRPFDSRRWIFPRLSRQDESPLSCTAKAQKRAAGSSSRALAGHSVVPAAMLVDETPTLARSVAAPIVTVSASRMAAAGGSQGKLVRPACVQLLFSQPCRALCCDGLLTCRSTSLHVVLAVTAAPCNMRTSAGPRAQPYKVLMTSATYRYPATRGAPGAFIASQGLYLGLGAWSNQRQISRP